MDNDPLRAEFSAYERFRAGLLRAIGDYQAWIERTGQAEPERDLATWRAIEALRHDRLTLAFVAEFSRGKSELVNALFFAEHGRRLLPSSPGRTTMCPVQILHDPDQPGSYLRLLPIETRLKATSLGDLDHDPLAWSVIPLDPASPAQLEAAFRELVAVKEVEAGLAVQLGLIEESAANGAPVEIPKWRQAVISYPHPLLEQGLVILDTPGLNALGCEPELTLRMIPAAQAVLFVLGADTGVTKSDLDVWREHLSHTGHGEGPVRLAVLNKIDTLWDDLKEPGEIDASIEAQRDSVARQLEIPRAQVFPVSAHKGLVARVRGDEALFSRTRLGELEQYLAERIVPERRRLLLDRVRHGVGERMEESRRLVETRLRAARAHLDELRGLDSHNRSLLDGKLDETLADRERLNRAAEHLANSRNVLKRKFEEFLAGIDLAALDRRLLDTRRAMIDSWTTIGLREAMRIAFEQLRDDFRALLRDGEEAARLLATIYGRLAGDHGMTARAPAAPDLARFAMRLEVLNEEAEAFRNSAHSALLEQGVLVRNFFEAIVSRARALYGEAHGACEDWVNGAFLPLDREIGEARQSLRRRLDSLERIRDAGENLAGRMDDLTREVATIEGHLAEIEAIRQVVAWGVPEGVGRTPVGSNIPRHAVNTSL